MGTSKKKQEPSPETISIEQEERPPMWKVWVLASRPHTLTASLSPCIVGYAVAATMVSSMTSISLLSLSFRWFLFCVLIQLATNLHNDYADFVKGADTKERVGQARATQKGWLTPYQTASASTACISLALAIGLPLLPTFSSDPAYYIMIATSCFNAVAYTGGPYPLGYIGLGDVSIAYWGLGDIFCFLYFGLVAVLTIPYIVIRCSGNTDEPLSALLTFQQNDDTASSRLEILPALPAAFLSTAIIVVNNLRDRHTDMKVHKRTLAVRFGALFCKLEYTLLLLASYGVAIYQASAGSGYLALLPLLTIPLAATGVRAMWTLEGRDLNPFVGKTAFVELLFCILQSVAMSLAA
jgi:1,4-dihydroxy-2-naphthoate octaprenyltransferase